VTDNDLLDPTAGSIYNQPYCFQRFKEGEEYGKFQGGAIYSYSWTEQRKPYRNLVESLDQGRCIQPS
jgi:hypothetical protein